MQPSEEILSHQQQQQQCKKGEDWKRLILAKHYKYQDQMANGFSKSVLRDRIGAISKESAEHNRCTMNKTRLNEALVYSTNHV